MKPFDILDALSDLPEDYAAQCLQKGILQEDPISEANPQPDEAGYGQPQHASEVKIIMRNKAIKAEKQKPIRISKTGIAAVVAFCIGLNAALIFGISKLQRNDSALPAGSEPEQTTVSEQQTETQPPKMVSGAEQPYEMKVMDAIPTRIQVELINNTFAQIELTPYFSVWQNGRKIEDCICLAQGENTLTLDKARPGGGEYGVVLNCQQLPAGTYTLRHFADENETPGAFGSADFEISHDYDNRIYISDCVGQQFGEVKAKLEAKGLIVEPEYVVCSDSNVAEGEVIWIGTDADRNAEESDRSLISLSYVGYELWATKGDRIFVRVSSGSGDGSKEITFIPKLMGASYPAAKEILLTMGLTVEDKTEFSDEIPAGYVIRADFEHVVSVSSSSAFAVGDNAVLVISLGSLKEETTVPDIIGLEWKRAARLIKRAGLLAAKQPVEASDAQTGTVLHMSEEPGETLRGRTVITVDVEKDACADDVYMTFTVPQGQAGRYYISVRDENMEAIGNSVVFDAAGFGSGGLYAECMEESLNVRAFLVNADTLEEQTIGTYTLHQGDESAAISPEELREAFRKLSSS